jgi:hypothetical protein
MTPADHARNAAISFECKKDSLRQMQNGDWRMSVTVQGIDMDERITRAAMGTRFVAVLVEIGSDEMPVTPAKETPAKPGQIPPKSDRVKRPWQEIPPAQQAGIRCDEPAFAAYLREQRPDDWHESPDPVDCVYLICGISSRAELGANQKARVIWHQIDTAFQAWKALEHA